MFLSQCLSEMLQHLTFNEVFSQLEPLYHA